MQDDLITAELIGGPKDGMRIDVRSDKRYIQINMLDTNTVMEGNCVKVSGTKHVYEKSYGNRFLHVGTRF